MKRFIKLQHQYLASVASSRPLPHKKQRKTVTTASGLKYVEVVVGKGASPTVGKRSRCITPGHLKTAKNLMSVDQ
jgi:FKBP-type peptidyl-prolyl cis-trans isomerase